jgi:putative tryptophan/tyrosine transport system substrate-binding protein
MLKILRLIIGLCLLFTLIQCGSKGHNPNDNIPTIGFLDAFEDETLKEAKSGFFDALKKEGFSEEGGTLKVEYRNAQNDFVVLQQSCDFLVAKNVKLLATNSTLSTITAAKKTKEIPIFMMVAPSPYLAGLSEKNGKSPANLSGVYEELSYIDTSLSLIRKFYQEGTKIGILYNNSEPQSVSAYERLIVVCKNLHLEPMGVSVNNSSETKTAVESLLQKGIRAFFAMPDNTIFASFEIIEKICSRKKIPIFTSEAGLVKRGALCAYGADIYSWGYQSGLMASTYLKSNPGVIQAPQIVAKRNKIWNEKAAKNSNLQIPDQSYQIIR